MTNKLTQKFISEEYKKKGYILISEYQNTHTILFVKNKEGYICSSRFSDFKQGRTPTMFHQSNPYTLKNIEHFIELNVKEYKLLSVKYINANSKLLFKCPKGHEFKMSWNNFKQGQRCPYCSNQKVLQGYNDILTTDAWMVDLGVSTEDAKTHTCCSGDKIIVTCPNCGKNKKNFISYYL